MDTQGLLPPPAKRRRRRHSPQFKTQVVAASMAPGASVAGVAQRFSVNANLVHKWRRQHRAAEGTGQDDFVRLPLLASAPPMPAADADLPQTIRVEVPGTLGTVTVHWPMTTIDSLASWLKALQA